MDDNDSGCSSDCSPALQTGQSSQKKSGKKKSDIESEDENSVSNSHPELTGGPGNISSTSLYIEVIHHPHSGSHTSSIIPISSKVGSNHSSAAAKGAYQIPVRGKPWAPFRTRADFEFAETAVVEGFNGHCTQKLLNMINSQWANNFKLTIFDTNDLNESLAAARNFVTQMGK
ncbi:hypothetical protein M422DRAFT_257483 [Sphaerobolus stellatus SS14]|uniref:Unplaced genomic scaffold SPHSTscaffold_75, whole genome shotgun sequence n=1 Tax=Sphaerobolus stellatus (strain SS14) TaxID=990650 RepID=A0A0C9VP82_SPHS4|nr:hypothetical protein M422DRAFT_257483 [Sphaerobolus stellatus SS14]